MKINQNLSMGSDIQSNIIMLIKRNLYNFEYSLYRLFILLGFKNKNYLYKINYQFNSIPTYIVYIYIVIIMY